MLLYTDMDKNILTLDFWELFYINGSIFDRIRDHISKT